MESRQTEMALKLAGRSLVTTFWDSEEPKLLGKLSVGGAKSANVHHHNATVCEAALERDQFSSTRTKHKQTTTGLLGKQSITALNDLSAVRSCDHMTSCDIIMQ